jgi:photosystem II stability/assembly factor-like uncharacterized protein
MWFKSIGRSFLHSGLIWLMAVAWLALPCPPALGSGAGSWPGTPDLFPDVGEAFVRLGSWTFGGASAVAHDQARNLVFLASGGAILVLDTSDETAPQLVSDTIDTRGFVTGLRYDSANQRLLVAAGLEGMQIWDVQTPSAPQLLGVGQVEVTGINPPIGNVDLYDHYALVECDWIGAASFDVSDPTNPVLVGLNSSSGSSTSDIHVSSDGYLHVVGDQYYARVHIQSDGTIPGVGGYPIGVARVVYGTPDAAFVERYGQLLIFDLGTGTYLASNTEVGYFYDMVAKGNTAYLAGVSSLMIYDVSDLENPTPLGSVDGYASKLEVSGDYAYLASGPAGLRTIDVSDPTQPVEIGFYDTFGWSGTTFMAGDRGYIAQGDDGIVILDLGDATQPALLGQYNTPGSAHDVKVVGDLAYVADYDGGLRIADVSDPANPVEIGTGAMDNAYLLTVAGSHAYVVDNVLNEPDWIRIFDVSSPASPVEVGSILMQSDIRELDVAGDHLFAAADDSGLCVLDVSDPTSPVVVGGFMAENTWDVTVRGDRAYVASADWYGGLLIFDVSDPTNPTLLSNYLPNDGWYHPFDVAVAGDFAYLSDPTNTSGDLVMVYIADPLAPVEVTSYSVPGDILDVAAVDSLVLISSGNAGLLLLENQLFSVPGGGVGWQAQESGTTSDLRAVHFVDAENGWATGDEGTMLYTANGGNEWQSLTSGTDEDLFALFFADVDTGWVGGRGGLILKTTDGGATWSPQTSGTTRQIRAIQFLDHDLGWAVGGGGVILKTTDGGESWQPQTSNTTGYLMSVCFVDPQHGWIAGDDGSQSATLKTINGGEDWQIVIPSPSTLGFGSIHFVDENVGWVVGYDAMIFKTFDGGDSWTLQYSDSLTSYTSLTGVHGFNANTCVAVGYTGVEGRSLKTMNRGDSWMNMYGAGNDILDAVYFADQSNGWAVGHRGTILAASTNQVPSDIVIGVPDDPDGPPAAGPQLGQNFPNPFNPRTTISYDLRGPARVSLKIYDVSGHLVRVLRDGVAETAGHHEVTWEGRDRAGRGVAAGVYFYRLQAGPYVGTRRMLLVK